MILTRARAIVLLSVCLLARPAAGQCTKKIAELPTAPELFGFHLGMTRDEIKARVPQTLFPKPDHFGVVKTTINPHFDPKIDQAKYAGVRSISLDLLDDRLTSLWIGYDEEFKVQTTEDFVKLISQSLQLSGPWSSWRSKGQQLRCADFQVIVSTLAGGPSLRLLDVAAEDTVAARRQAKEEQDAAAEASRGSTDGEEFPTITGDRQSKTYYLNGCQPAKEISEINKVTFKTAEEAQRAGFKLAKNCH
jgi:hypothetical protein